MGIVTERCKIHWNYIIFILPYIDSLWILLQLNCCGIDGFEDFPKCITTYPKSCCKGIKEGVICNNSTVAGFKRAKGCKLAVQSKWNQEWNGVIQPKLKAMGGVTIGAVVVNVIFSIFFLLISMIYFHVSYEGCNAYILFYRQSVPYHRFVLHCAFRMRVKHCAFVMHIKPAFNFVTIWFLLFRAPMGSLKVF